MYPLVSSSHPLLVPPVEDHCGQSFLEEGEQNKCTEKMLQKQKLNQVEIHCVDLHEYQIQQLDEIKWRETIHQICIKVRMCTKKVNIKVTYKNKFTKRRGMKIVQIPGKAIKTT